MMKHDPIEMHDFIDVFVGNAKEDGVCPSCLVKSMFIFSANQIIRSYKDDREGMEVVKSMLSKYWEIKAESNASSKMLQ